MYHQQPNNMQMPYGNMPQQGMMGNNPMMNMPQMEQGAMNNDMHDYCKEHIYHAIIVEMKDGEKYDGIIENVDQEHVYLLIPIGEEEDESPSPQERQYGGLGGYGPGYGPGYGYGYPRRFRRFRRYRFPFFGIRRFFFPFFF